MYRVYNLISKEWVKDTYLSQENELYLLKKNLFNIKLLPLSQDDYIIHNYICLDDKNNVPVYEGDIIEACLTNDKKVLGIVTYAPELSSYVILCFNPDEFYVLGTDICQFIEVKGNIIDNASLLPEYKGLFDVNYNND